MGWSKGKGNSPRASHIGWLLPMTDKLATYVDVRTFARIANLKERTARSALAACSRGEPWCGVILTVRKTAPIGRGRPGYEVRADSLPPELQSKFVVKTVPAVATRPRRDQPVHIEGEFDWKVKHEIIAPILRLPRGSAARAAAVRDAAECKYRTQTGLVTFSRAAIRRWLAAYEKPDGGVGALARKERADRRVPRVLISRPWDRLDLPRDVQERIAAELRTYVRSLWAGPTVFAGYRATADYAETKLLNLTSAAYGVPLSDAVRAACAVPRAFVEKERKFRMVGERSRDRKAYNDHTLPRVSRSLDGLRPMQLVQQDNHHKDAYYKREDGTLATAKLTASLDVATQRIRCDVRFFEKGRGVQEKHVIQSFIAMALDPCWGLPARLYLDNGSEYQWDHFIADAIALSGMAITLDGEISEGMRATTRAQAYNAPAKGDIEGAFGRLERFHFSLIPGWIAGDRSRAKVANVGQAPVHYPGTKEELVRDVQHAIAVYNDTPQKQGRLKGKSPNQRFNEFVRDGWKYTKIDEASLYAAFSERVGCKINQGVVRYKGRKYYHDRLSGLPAGTPVSIGVPKWSEPDRVALWDEVGNFIGVMDADRAYEQSTPDGAIESSRRKKVNSNAAAELKAQTVPLDHRVLLAERAARADAIDIPDHGSVVTFDRNLAAAGAELAKPAKVRRQEQEQRDSQAGDHQATVLRRLREASGS